MNKKLYQDLYDLEDVHWWHLSKRQLCVDVLRRYLTVRKPHMLDVGCGTGKNLETFMKIGTAWGLDPSPHAIKFCRLRGLRNVKQEKINHTSFKDCSFHAVTVLDVLEHVNERTALKEISRLLKPKGLLLITVPAYQFLWSKWDEILHHRKRYSKKDLIQLLTDYGFKIEQSSYLYSFLLPPVILVRCLKSVLFNNANYSSDFKIGSGITDRIFLFLSRCEHNLIQRVSVPFGLSLVVIARK